MSAVAALAQPQDGVPSRSIQAILDDGDACLARRAHADAARHFAEAARHAPRDPAIRRWLLIALMRAGEVPTVLEQAEVLLTLAPNDTESVRLVAYVYLELHRQSQALLEWPGEPERVDTAAAGFPLPLFIPLASSLLPHAVVLARLAVANDPANAAALRTLAQALGEAGEYREALAAAHGSVQHGDGADARLTLARLSANAGLRKEATDALLDPVLVAIAPSLATGRQIFVRYDAPEEGSATVREVPVHLLRDGQFATRRVQVAHRTAQCETVRDAEVVGTHFFPILPDGTAKVHDVVELDALHLSHPLPLDRLPAADRICTVLAHDRASRQLWLHVPREGARHVERAALLATNAHENYCHWLLGSLPRLLIAGAAAEAIEAPWIVPHGLAPFQEETLDLLGLPGDRLLRVRDDETVRVGELIVAYDPQCAGTPAPALVNGIRQRLLGQEVLHVLGVERPSALPHPHWHYAVALDDVRRALDWVSR